MKLPNPTGLIRVGKMFVMANRPEILFGASVVSTIGAVVLAAKGGYEARGIIDTERISRMPQPEGRFDTFLEYRAAQDALDVPLTHKEMANLTWQCYIPALTLTVGSLGATTGMHIVHIKEKKALGTAALAAIDEIRTEAKTYEKALFETDPEKSEEVRKELEEETTRNGHKAKEFENEPLIEELYLVRDGYTGRPFHLTRARVEEGVNRVNAEINKTGSADLNTFYMWAGIPELERGVEEGWSGQLVSVSWDDEHLDDGRPISTFHFLTPPKKGYDDAHA